MRDESSVKGRRLAYLLVLCLGFASFLPSLANRYALDDKLALSIDDAHGPDSMIAELHPPWHYFGNQYWAGAGASHDSTLYRPVTIYSYALTFNLLAKSSLPPNWPKGIERMPLVESEAHLAIESWYHHLINVLLNAVAGCLVLWMLLNLGLPLFGATLTAALFAVHALHSEVVASIVGRAELLSLCFGVLGIQAFCRGGSTASSARSLPWLSLSSALFFLSMCSKESGVAFVPFLPCYLAARTWLAHPETPMRSVLSGRAVSVLGVGVVALVAFLVLRGVTVSGIHENVSYAANPLYHEPFTVRLLTAVKVLGYAIYKCVAPFSLACEYGVPALGLVLSPLDVGFLAGLAACLVWSVAGLLRPARTPLLFLSVAVFFGFGLLTSNLPFAIGTIFGERLYFIPSLGVCLLPAILLPRLAGNWRRALIFVCGVWIVACIVVDIERCRLWRDTQTISIHDAAVQPSAELQLKAADLHTWLQESQPARAEFHHNEARRLLRRAIELDPEHLAANSMVSRLQSEAGDFDGAIATLQHMLTSRRIGMPGLASVAAGVRAKLGVMLIEQRGQLAPGVAMLSAAVRLAPSKLEFRVLLLDHGMAVLAPQEARRILQDGERLFPNSGPLQLCIASFLCHHSTRGPTGQLKTGAARQIAGILGRVFQVLSPTAIDRARFVTARLQLAEALKSLGQSAEARTQYESLIAMQSATARQKAEARAALRALR